MRQGRVGSGGRCPIGRFGADDVAGLRVECETSVDDYLASCVEDGIEPRKPFSGKLNLRLGPELHQQLAVSAQEEGVSLNSLIVETLKERATG